MKKTISILFSVSLLTACNSSGPAAESVTNLAPEVSPMALPVDPVPSPTPSPSPSPTPVAPYTFGGGSGTALDPYKLDTATDVDHIRDFPAAYYVVTQDISMNGITWVPIPVFSGSIYGAGMGKRLTDLVIATTGKAAFITSLTGLIDRLDLTNLSSTSSTTTATGWASRVEATGWLHYVGVQGTIQGGTGVVGNPAYTSLTAGGKIEHVQVNATFYGSAVSTTYNP